MTNRQLGDVLDWQYPTIGKAYHVQHGILVFLLWLDRATGLPSQTAQPTIAQCEAWLPDLPAKAKTQREQDCEAAKVAIDAALADWTVTKAKDALAAVKKVL